MADDLPESFMPHVAQLQPAPITPAIDVNTQLEQPAPVDAEQAKLAEAYFQQSPESQAVSGLLSLYTSAVLLTDLAAEHFAHPEDEEDEEDLVSRQSANDERK